MEGGCPGGTRRAAKPHSLGHRRCRGGHSGVSFFQHLKIQRSVGRARDGATFPVSLKLKSQPGSEEATDGEAAPGGGYSASIWVFSTISGLITLLPDGTIYGINHSFALMLFGYGKAELLGKVGRGPGVTPSGLCALPAAAVAGFPGDLGPESGTSALAPRPTCARLSGPPTEPLRAWCPPGEGRGSAQKPVPHEVWPEFLQGGVTACMPPPTIRGWRWVGSEGASL